MYQLQTRLVDILNLPLHDKIQQLRFCIETASIKDLQAFFPALVHNIFGINPQNAVGWGLRTTTAESSAEYHLLYNFFNPHETFFRLIYRLQNTFSKFEFSFLDLPRGFKVMLEGARIDGFYTKLISTDHFQPKMLSLNAFDFFILHFVTYGTRNLHKVSPAAMSVNNENTMTVYFNLAADYLCNFLPNDPNSVVYPQIDASPIKSPPAPIISSPMIKMRQPKYLMLSSLSHQMQGPTNQRDVRLENTRNSSANWRSESIMMFFIDCWLRYDMDETYLAELPSNEFVRLLRILVKQLHYFGNSADQDTSSLAILRQQSQSLLNARMYSFLKTIMARWPLDTSFINILELWLSYIQPWRYVYNRNVQNLNNEIIDIPDRFKTFMNENLLSYTQIFVRIIPRFLKMDMSINKNAHMLFRILKVFRQPSDLLREYERILINSNSMIRSHNSSFHDTSIHSPNNSINNRSGDKFSLHRHASQSAIFEDSSYICMFSDEVTMQIYELMQRVYSAKMKINSEVASMEKQLNQNITLWERFLRFFGWLSSLNFSFSKTLEEKKRTPVYLDFILNILSPMYSIPIEEATKEFTANESIMEESDNEGGMQSNSSFLNITPSYMKSQLSNISYTGDPELLPIMSSEIRPLVRFLYPITSKLNELFGNEINAVYNREDIYGKIGRQVLTPPVETREFDKSAGYSELQIKQIGPRVSLRKFASKKILALFIASFIIGRIFFGASSLGFITFIFVSFIYLIVKAMFSSS